MTDEERKELRTQKEGVSGRLGRLDIPSYNLGEIDQRLEDYTLEVARNPHRHNLWEQLGVERFFRMIDRYGINADEIRRFFLFYEFLHFPGRRGMTRYRLTPVQCFQFASVYGFWREPTQEERETSGSDAMRRVVRECVLYVPRKFSKTTGSAAFALWDLLYGDANAEAYIGANSQDQAKKCFEAIRGALLRLDPHGRRFVINKADIRPTRRNPRAAFAQCLTANARTKDGLNASTVIMDEFSQARDSELLNVLTTSMGVRENPLTVIITTASDVFDGPFYPMLTGYKEILLGKYEDDTVFAHLFEPDVDDREDDPATWRKVHPHLGVTVQPTFYDEEWKKTRRAGAELLLAFRTKLLNLYTEDETQSWISATMIRDHTRPLNLEHLGVRLPGTVGIDLSVSDDFSAVTVGVYDEEKGEISYRTDYFFPRGALSGHRNELLYRKWAAAGHLHLQEGDVINYEEIVEHILWLNRYVEIFAICYDPAKSLECVNMIGSTDIGWALKPFRQTNFYFTSAVQSFEIGIKTGHIWIDDNPITPYCFGNAVLEIDRMDNMKPYKRTASGKIDGVITTLMAQAAFNDGQRMMI